jgi:hypothetical protein
MARAISTNGEKRNAYRILVGKPKRKRPLGRLRHRWEYNVRMYHGQIRWNYGLDRLTEDRALVNTVMNFILFI